MGDLSVPARLLGYVAALGLTGAATFQTVVRARIHREFPETSAALLARTRRVAIVLAVLLVIAALLRLQAQVHSLVDPGEPITRDLYRAMLGTVWGHSWILQWSAALAGLVVLVIVRDTRVLVPLALLVAGLGPFTGHASENPLGRFFGVSLHAIHQLGGGAWLGTLAMVVLVGYGGTRRIDDTARHRIIALLVEAFSPIALTGVGIAVVAGVVLSYQYVGSFSALLSSSYGTTLLIKVGMLALTAGLGAWNWRRVRPTLGEAGASARLYYSATLELIVGTLLLGATALLVGTEAPGLH
jgi:putative copper export protein